MGRLERRLFKLNDRLAELAREIELIREELTFHRHLHDDAYRDALVTEHPEDRAEARQTAADVARFEKVLQRLEDERTRLDRQRLRLLRKLEDL
jgi:superfamily I DNA and RNA helicase